MPTATTISVAAPPSTTEPTAPNQSAVTPDSNSPSWFDVPTKSELTALTRPRISSGVAVCTRVERTTTLTTSAAPIAISATIVSQIQCDRPKRIVAAPNTATAANILWPTLCSSGWRAR